MSAVTIIPVKREERPCGNPCPVPCCPAAREAVANAEAKR